MSDEELQIVQTEEGQMLTAEYKDGQLQIVEVTPFDKSNEATILPDMSSDGEQTKYLRVLDSGGKQLVQLDLLNFTVVKMDDNESSYQVVESSTTEDGDTTLTCVLSTDDNEEAENQESYVLMNSSEEPPMVLMQNPQRRQVTDKKNLTPTEILEKAKALQKSKSLSKWPGSARGRKRACDLPPPMEMLASPNFKLYLYSCKLCSFKCNAVKQMSEHKATEHWGKARGTSGRSPGSLQCARCPFKGTVHSMLHKHVQEAHIDKEVSNGTVELVSNDIDEADVLVCGACGFESSCRETFSDHIQQRHGASIALQNLL